MFHVRTKILFDEDDGGDTEAQSPRVVGQIQFRHLVPSAKRVFAVGSGKGGVGKSSTAVNLAIALAKQHKRVGLVDADIYGPSLPKLLGTEGAELTLTNEKINPLEQFGLQTLSIGNLIPPDRAAIWRGPMLHQALQRLLGGVNWGELDVLLVDLPPGTGDVHLTMMQSLKIDGAVIVTTPQEVAISDVRKCIDMFQKVEVPIAGVIENMAYFECRHGERYYLFGQGGGERLAAALQLPFLGSIPLIPAIMEGGEQGKPYALDDPHGIFQKMSEKLMETK